MNRVAVDRINFQYDWFGPIQDESKQPLYSYVTADVTVEMSRLVRMSGEVRLTPDEMNEIAALVHRIGERVASDVNQHLIDPVTEMTMYG